MQRLIYRNGTRKLLSEFKKISMTGRLCYLFMCLERYLVSRYPDRDWTPVAKRCWQWTNVYWDEGEATYSPVVPEFILEFENYEETNARVFDGGLSEEDYFELINLYKDIATGREEEEINQILMLPISFSSICDGTNFAQADDSTLNVLHEAQQFLCSHNIPLPLISEIGNLTICKSNEWGDYLDSKYLSIIIK